VPTGAAADHKLTFEIDPIGAPQDAVTGEPAKMTQITIKAPLKLEPISLINRDDWIIERVKGKKVLHAGPTDNLLTDSRAGLDQLLHQKLRRAGCQVTGVDIDLEGINFLRTKFGIDDIVHGSIEVLDEVFPDQKFDVILAADVMEHLNNPGLFLQSARKLLEPDGELIITVPNAFSFKKFLGVAIFHEERNHPDHVSFYSFMNLHQLLGRFDFIIIKKFAFLIVDPNKRRANVWGNRIAHLVMRILRNNSVADELAVVAKLA
jgi:2-polyprenyl-3-methyl-5-hydroxy-6-metoxy-1,4-benzoquinol methylase